MLVTCANLVATLKSMSVAASITVSGSCEPAIYISAAPPGTILDFSAAPVVRLDLLNVSGITLNGLVSTGAPYSGLNVRNSRQILVIRPHVLYSGSAGITIQGSDTIEVANPWITRWAGDGVDIAGSSNINIHDGACEDPVVFPGTPSPVCVRSWSATGYPLLHIFVQNMVVVGSSAGFGVVDSRDLGARDVEILNNHAAIGQKYCVVVSYVHALVVTGNDCHTLASPYGPTTIFIEESPDANVSNNSVAVLP